MITMSSQPAAKRTWPTRSEAAAQLVRGREGRATELGRSLAEDLHDPVRFARRLAAAFRELKRRNDETAALAAPL